MHSWYKRNLSCLLFPAELTFDVCSMGVLGDLTRGEFAFNVLDCKILGFSFITLLFEVRYFAFLTEIFSDKFSRLLFRHVSSDFSSLSESIKSYVFACKLRFFNFLESAKVNSSQLASFSSETESQILSFESIS